LAYRDPGYSLDLLLPAHDAYGLLRFEATISAAGATPASIEVSFTLNLKQTMLLNAVLIRYRGAASRDPGAPVLNLPPPTFQEFQNTASWAINCFPVSANPDIKLMGELEYTQPLTPLNGDQIGPWAELKAAVLQAALASPAKRGGTIHGLLPASLLNYYMPGVGGYGGNGVGVSFAGNGRDLAHEFGHSAGLGHAPCPSTIGDPDPNFPTYPHPLGPGPAAHIGEFGMDCSTGTVMHFDAYRDLMSDCPPFWISPYHYRKLLHNEKFDPIEFPVDLPSNNFPQPVHGIPKKWLPYPPLRPYPKGIAVIGLESPRGEVEIRYVTRTQIDEKWSSGEPSGIKVQLIGARNKVIAEASLQRSFGQMLGRAPERSRACQPRESGVLTGVIKCTERGESLRVVKGKRVLWSRRAPVKAIRIRNFKAKVADGKLVAKWDAEPARGEAIHFWLRYRLHGQTAWNALKTGIRESPVDMELAYMLSGRIEIEVIAHDGFNSASAMPVTVSIPKRAPVPVILHPCRDDSLVAGRMIRLWGNAVLCNGDYAKPATLTWKIDGKRVGEGDDIWVTAPAPGSHECALSAKDGNGQQEHRICFVTVDRKATDN